MNTKIFAGLSGIFKNIFSKKTEKVEKVLDVLAAEKAAMSRREFLTLLGVAAGAGALVTGCKKSKDNDPILPIGPGGPVIPETVLNKLYNFLHSDQASYRFTNPVSNLPERAVYHNTMRDTHIKCRYGTTTETMALKFILDVLYGKIKGSTTAQDETYNYFSGEMWPHDGRSSYQLPDQNLNFLGAPTRLAPWLIQVKSSLFGRDNTLYEIYNEPEYGTDPISDITLDASGYPTFVPEAKWGGIDTNNHFRFGAALDADQWMILGYMLSGFLGNKDYLADIKETKKSLLPFLSNTGAYKNIMKFAANWGGRVIDDRAANTWKTAVEDLYTAYQMPAVWLAMNEPLIASQTMNFIYDSQTDFKNKTGQEGLFTPLYKNGIFTFNGADPNTHWMGFQYRTFRAVAFYYAATGDAAAKACLDKFIAWVESNKNSEAVLPFWIYSHMTDGEGITHNGGALGAVERHLYSPHEYGLYSQGLSLLYSVSGNEDYKTIRDRVNQKIVSEQNSNGSFIDKESNTWYGFHQGEAGIAVALTELDDEWDDWRDYLTAYKSNFIQEVTTLNPIYLEPKYFPQHITNWHSFDDNLLPENVTVQDGVISMHGITNAWWVGSMSSSMTDDLSNYHYLQFKATAGKAQLQIQLDGFNYQIPIDATSEEQLITINLITEFGLTPELLANGVLIRLGLVAYDASYANGSDISLAVSVPTFR